MRWLLIAALIACAPPRPTQSPGTRDGGPPGGEPGTEPTGSPVLTCTLFWNGVRCTAGR